MNVRTQRTAALALSVGMLIGITGCSGSKDAPEPEPTVSTTAVPVPAPAGEATAGPAEPLEQAALRGVNVSIYLDQSYPAQFGCGCAAEDGGPEMWPAGTRAMTFRITLAAQYDTRRNTVTVPDLHLDTSLAGLSGPAIAEEHEGPERAQTVGVAWQPDGLFPESGTLRYDAPQSFMVAYYVPEGVQRIDFELSGYYDPVELDMPQTSSTVSITLP